MKLSDRLSDSQRIANQRVLIEKLKDQQRRRDRAFSKGYEYVPEACQMANEQFISEFIEVAIRYFAWLRTQHAVSRDDCLRVTVKKIKSMFRLEEKS